MKQEFLTKAYTMLKYSLLYQREIGITDTDLDELLDIITLDITTHCGDKYNDYLDTITTSELIGDLLLCAGGEF